MKKKFGFWLVISLFTASFLDAQQAGRIQRIGYVSGTGNAANQGPYVEALRAGLRKLGYVEGKSFTIEYRGAEGRTNDVPALVAELVELPVDIVIAPILPAILAANRPPKRFRL